MLRGLCVFLFLIGIPCFALSQGFSSRSFELNIGIGASLRGVKAFQIGPPQSSAVIEEEMKFDNNKRYDMRLNFFMIARIGTEGFYSYEIPMLNFNRLTAPSETLAVPLQVHNFGANLLYYPIGT